MIVGTYLAVFCKIGKCEANKIIKMFYEASGSGFVCRSILCRTRFDLADN